MRKHLLIVIITIFSILLNTTSYAQKNKVATGNLKGRVIDHNGEPIPGAVIELYKGKYLRSKSTTNVNGTYYFENIPALRYKLIARFDTKSKSPKTDTFVSVLSQKTITVNRALNCMSDCEGLISIPAKQKK